MQPSEIDLFLQKFAAGSHTEAEHQLFIDWLQNAPVTAIEQVLDKYNALAERVPTNEICPDRAIVINIEAALDQYQLADPVRYRPVSLMAWQKIGSIAAVLLVMLVSALVVLLSIKPGPAQINAGMAARNASSYKKELTPGSSKAILTLADGSAISLADAKNGRIAQQGNSRVDKTAEGQLVYQPAATPMAEVVYNTLSTPRGGQFKLLLPDGSAVWLNAASSIKYPAAFTGHQRKVEISGEAYFEVTHNPARPFIVAANGMEVTVLGTHFNINAYNDEAALKTSLLEGSVRLEKDGAKVQLLPGQQAQLTFNGNFKVVTNVDMEDVIAWKNGYFSFTRANLQTVMRQIARWYDVNIEYEGKVPERLFGGKIDRNSNASDVLKILEESKVHFTIEDKKIIVKP